MNLLLNRKDINKILAKTQVGGTPGTPVSSTNKTVHFDISITEILLKVAFKKLTGPNKVLLVLGPTTCAHHGLSLS